MNSRQLEQPQLIPLIMAEIIIRAATKLIFRILILDSNIQIHISYSFHP